MSVLSRSTSQRSAGLDGDSNPPRIDVSNGVTANPEDPRFARLGRRLVELSAKVEPAHLFPARTPEASSLALDDPFAFALATCLDRQTLADIIWTVPYDLKARLGHLDPALIHRMSEDELLRMLKSLPRKPRFINAAARTVKDLARIVIEECSGDASLLWKDKTASQVKTAFRRIHGVGPGIANMAVIIIEKAFGVRFSDLDHRQMDIKADVHTKRVLYRLGAAPEISDSAAIAAARRLSPEYSGAIDSALWRIGRNWCHPDGPDCTPCPVSDVCLKVGVA